MVRIIPLRYEQQTLENIGYLKAQLEQLHNAGYEIDQTYELPQQQVSLLILKERPTDFFHRAARLFRPKQTSVKVMDSGKPA